MAITYLSAEGEHIDVEDYQRWCERGEEALRIPEQDGIDNIHDALTDILTHIRHYCDRHTLDFENAVRLSYQHFSAERPVKFPTKRSRRRK